MRAWLRVLIGPVAARPVERPRRRWAGVSIPKAGGVEMRLFKETLKGALISSVVVAAICWVVFGYLCDIPVFVWRPKPFLELYSLGQVVAIVAAAGFVVGGFIGDCGATLDKD